MQLQMSNKVGSCCASVCHFLPACFASCNSFFVDYSVVFMSENNHLGYHLSKGSDWIHPPTYLCIATRNFFLAGTIWLAAVRFKLQSVKWRVDALHTFFNSIIFTIWAWGVKSRVIDVKVKVKLQVIIFMTWVWFKSKSCDSSPHLC